MLIDDRTSRAAQLVLQREWLVLAVSAYRVTYQGQTILYVTQPFQLLRTLWALVAACAAGALVIVAAFFVLPTVPLDLQPVVMLGAIIGCCGVVLVVGLTQFPLRHYQFWRDESRFAEAFEATQQRRRGFPHTAFTVRDVTGQHIGTVLKEAGLWYGTDTRSVQRVTAVPEARPLAAIWNIIGIFLPIAHLIGAVRVRTRYNLMRGVQPIGQLRRKPGTITIDVADATRELLD